MTRLEHTFPLLLWRMQLIRNLNCSSLLAGAILWTIWQRTQLLTDDGYPQLKEKVYPGQTGGASGTMYVRPDTLVITQGRSHSHRFLERLDGG